MFENHQNRQNHELRKYHCKLAVEHYISKGWTEKKQKKLSFKGIFSVILENYT